jgi:hypothetical protein
VAALDLGAHTRRVLVAPRRFDEQLSGISVSVLGNAALTALVTRGVFGWRDAEPGHQLAWVREA